MKLSYRIEAKVVPKYANRNIVTLAFSDIYQVYQARNISQCKRYPNYIKAQEPAQGCRRERIGGANSYTLSLESRSVLLLRYIRCPRSSLEIGSR